MAHKNLYYWLLKKFRSGNPGSVWPHGNNQPPLRSGRLLAQGLLASLGHRPCLLPGPSSARLYGQLTSKRAILCAMQAEFLLHFEFYLSELMAKKNSGDTQGQSWNTEREWTTLQPRWPQQKVSNPFYCEPERWAFLLLEVRTLCSSRLLPHVS